MRRDHHLVAPLALLAAVAWTPLAFAADHGHAPAGGHAAAPAHGAHDAHAAPAKGKKAAKKKPAAHGEPEAATHGEADAGGHDGHQAPKAAAHKASSAHETKPDADGTFTIQLDDPDADVPAGAPKGDLHGGKRTGHGPAPATHAPAHGEDADAHGKAADAHGKAADAHGKTADAHGKATDAHGKAPDAHGKATDAHGKAPDAHGKAADAHGKAPDAHGKAADAHGKAPDAHGKAADSHGKAPDAHGKAADSHGKAPDAHGKAADAHGKAADAHGKAPDAHGDAADAHDGHGAGHEAAPAQGKPAAHGEAETDEASDDEADGDETHDLLDDAATKPKPKPKPKPRDWKPLTGTGFAEARRNKWGVVEAVPPAIAARTRMAFRGDEVEFPDKVHFKYNSITFERGADEVVAKIADSLQASPEIQKLWIEGHTDLSGGEAYNQKLSEARASAVREALVRRGVAPERLVAYGFGESRPATAERRGKGVPENRRVVFRLVQADRPALQTRRVVEFGQAAVIGVWGAVRYRVSALGAASRTPERFPTTAFARNAADAAESHGGSPTSTDAHGGDVGADAEADAIAAGMEDEGGWRPLPFRTQLPEGAVIETGAGGMALLRLPDLTRILVHGDTRLALTKLFHNHTEGKSYTSARLETGSLRVSANPDERGVSSGIWSFPGGAVELTSADFELLARAEGTSLAVLRGGVKASNGGAESIAVRMGERLPPGAAAPMSLLAGPEIESPVNGTVADVVLVWKPVPGAVRYQVEVAEDLAFYQPKHADETAETRLTLADLDTGRPWYWRVRAISDDGALGLSSRLYSFRTSGPAAAAPAAATPASAPASASAPAHDAH
jgi:outer membrane protein OmpA-like peptidoglycan-associated protein